MIINAISICLVVPPDLASVATKAKNMSYFRFKTDHTLMDSLPRGYITGALFSLLSDQSIVREGAWHEPEAQQDQGRALRRSRSSGSSCSMSEMRCIKPESNSVVDQTLDARD